MTRGQGTFRRLTDQDKLYGKLYAGFIVASNPVHPMAAITPAAPVNQAPNTASPRLTSWYQVDQCVTTCCRSGSIEHRRRHVAAVVPADPRPGCVTGRTPSRTALYLTEFLPEKGYEVHGIFRRCSTFNTDRIEHLYVDAHDPDARLFLHAGDMADGTGLRHILENVRPDEVYNLAAQSHVRISFRSGFTRQDRAAVAGPIRPPSARLRRVSRPSSETRVL